MSKQSGFVVELGVRSVEASLSFYVEGLGCSLVEVVADEDGRKIWGEIDLFGSRAMLQDLALLSAELPGIASSGATNRFALVVRIGSKDAAKQLFAGLRGRAISVNSGPNETDYGTFEFSVVDPDGFVVLVAGRD